MAFQKFSIGNKSTHIILTIEAANLSSGAAKVARRIPKSLAEELLQDIILKTINETILDKSSYMKMLQENIATVIRNDASASTDDIGAKLLELQKKLLQKANNRDDYDSIAEEIFQLRELKA